MRVPLQALGDALQLLEGIGTTRMQLAASVVLLVGAFIAGAFVAPFAVRVVREQLVERVVRGPVEEFLTRVGRYVPWGVSATVFLRVLQGGILTATGLALLVLWGQLWLAVAVLAFIELVLPEVVRVGLTVCLLTGAYVGTRVLEDSITQFSQQSDTFTRHQEQIAFRVLQLVLFAAAGLISLTLWEVDLSGLLVGAGFLGIVVGMAARQTLGSLIAGFVLMFSRPFEIGNWVKIGRHEGIVTDITIVNTRLENFDGEFVVIPNDRVGDSVITNRTKKGRLRLRTEVGIDYDADTEHAEDVAVEALREVDEILTVPMPEAVPTSFGDSAVVLELRFWIEKPTAKRKARATAAAIRAVKAAYDREGIEIPYPQRELTDREGAGGSRVRDEQLKHPGYAADASRTE